MFQALAHRRADHALARDPAEVPELVAAAVMGACRYLPDPAAVLVPFLGQARVEGAGRLLSERLGGVASASVALWPPAPGADGGGAPPLLAAGWSPRPAPLPEGEAGDGEELEEPERVEDEGEPRIEPGRLPAPDAVVTLRRPGQPDGWVLVEALGPDGRLSGIDGTEDPGGRLAAHWQAARQAAGAAGVPLGVVLVSASGSVPGMLFAWARAALRRAGEPPAPFYGLSWRAFPACARAAGPPPPLLADLLDLLEESWGLCDVEPLPWPAPAGLPPAGRPPGSFRAAFGWPAPCPLPKALPGGET